MGLGTSPATAATVSRAIKAAGPVPGTIVVVNGGGVSPAQGTGEGSVTLYRPGASGDARPEAELTKGIDGPDSVAVDSSGDLWVANSTGTVVEYGRAELSEASPIPTVTISGGASGHLVNPFGLSLDPSGDLWVADGGTGTVVEFAKAQLARSGSPVPVFNLSPSNCSLVFDASGDLWQGSTGASVSEWAKAELSKSGFPVPRVTITSDSLNGPCKPAFDPKGDLWAGNYNSDTVVEFTKADLARSGSAAPKIVISSSQNGTPGDVAVDASGDLWVPTMRPNSVVEYTKAQLTKSGSPAPALTIAGPATKLNWPWAVAIDP
jgi:sugar lactone lactonase YvrE